MPTGVLRESSAICCWCQSRLVELASSPGMWWCPTPACYQQQLTWGVIRTGRNAKGPYQERLFLPTPRQVAYQSHPARYRLFGGAAGPGKSTAMRWLLYRQCLRIPGYEALILRETYPELEKTHLRRMGPEADLIGATFTESKRIMKFDNGSLIECGHMDDESAVRKYLSTEYDHIAPDEGSNYPWQPLLELSTRARSSKPAVLANGGARFDVVTNPGGQASQMLKDLFIDHVVDPDIYPVLASIDERTGKPNYVPEEWAYIPATLDDNPYGDPNYHRSLAVLSKWRYEQLRYGNWDVVQGQFFSTWNPRRHVVDHDILDPLHATWFRSLDWGYHDPCVVQWWWVRPDQHVHIAGELRLREHTIDDVVKEVQAMDRSLGLPKPVSSIRTYADPSVRQRQGQTGESIQETFGRNGMPLIPAVNERKNGWMRVQMLLKNAPDGDPWLTVDPTCKYLIRSMSRAMSDPKEPDDIELADDHALDCLRYGAMSRPMPKGQPEPERAQPGTAGHLLDELIAATGRPVLGSGAVLHG